MLCDAFSNCGLSANAARKLAHISPFNARMDLIKEKNYDGLVPDLSHITGGLAPSGIARGLRCVRPAQCGYLRRAAIFDRLLAASEHKILTLTFMICLIENGEAYLDSHKRPKFTLGHCMHPT